MSKIIKKNIDIIIVSGMGLVLLVGGLISVYEKVAVDYVSAATTADVTVSATVAQSAVLTVSLVNSGVAVNGSNTTVTTTDTTVPLGTLTTGSNTVAAHTLTMSTNAGSGYTVNTKYNHKLWRASATSSDIDDHLGSNAVPNASFDAGTEAFGYTTEDFSLAGTADRFSGGKWAAFTTSDLEVAYHTAPVNATTTKIGYQAGIDGLTAAGDDYESTITYTMTASF